MSWLEFAEEILTAGQLRWIGFDQLDYHFVQHGGLYLHVQISASFEV